MQIMGRRRVLSVALFAVLLASTGVDTVVARGLRSDKQQQSSLEPQGKNNDKQGPPPTPPPPPGVPPPPPPGVPPPPPPILAATPDTPAPDVDMAQLPEREALTRLHEDMVIDLMSANPSSSFVAQGDAGGRRTQAWEPYIGRNNGPGANVGSIWLLNDASPPPSTGAVHREAFVAQGDAGHGGRRTQAWEPYIGRNNVPGANVGSIWRMSADSSAAAEAIAHGEATADHEGHRSLQFGIPGVGGIGMPGVGNIGLGSLYGAAQAGANVLRQGAYTAMELNQLRKDYEKRCKLGEGEAEMFHPTKVETTRHLQSLMGMGANAMYRGAMEYGRDAACPTAEQRAEYLSLKNHATKFLQAKDEVQTENESRMLLQRQARGEVGAEEPVHRQTIARYPRHLQEAGKRPVPDPISGEEIIARQMEYKEQNSAIKVSNANAEFLKQAMATGTLSQLVQGANILGRFSGGGNNNNAAAPQGPLAAAAAAAGLGGGAGKRKPLTEADLDSYDGYDDDGDEHDDTDLGPFRMMAGESVEEHRARKHAARLARKAAHKAHRLEKKEERKERREHSPLGHW